MKRREFLKGLALLTAGALFSPDELWKRAEAAVWHTGEALPLVEVKNTYLSFNYLSNREVTDAIIVHHTAGSADASAAEIHRMHKQNGWAGIGYHFVIRWDGSVEKGRPMGSIGAHCYGENDHTLGVALTGNFESAEPTEEQLESLSRLLAALSMAYGFEPSEETIFGHRDFNATACPGRNLYRELGSVIVEAARLYRTGE